MHADLQGQKKAKDTTQVKQKRKVDWPVSIVS